MNTPTDPLRKRNRPLPPEEKNLRRMQDRQELMDRDAIEFWCCFAASFGTYFKDEPYPL